MNKIVGTGSNASGGGDSDEYEATLNEKLIAEKNSYETKLELLQGFHEEEKKAGKTSEEDKNARLEVSEGLYSKYLDNIKSLVEEGAVDAKEAGDDKCML